MDPGRLLAALGSAVTAFLLVSVAIIEALDFEFSALVALPVGGMVAFAVLLGVIVYYGRLGTTARLAVESVAAFGLTLAIFAGLSYVDLGGFRGALSVQSWLLLAVGVAVVSYAVRAIRSAGGTSQ